MESYDDSAPTQIKVPTWEELGPAVTSWKEPGLERRNFQTRLRALRQAERQEAVQKQRQGRNLPPTSN